MAEGSTKTVANMDVATLASYFVAFAKEIQASQSARQREFVQHDRQRAQAYLDRLQAYADLTAEANLDLPKSHPDTYPVPDFLPDADIESLENEIVKAVLRRFKAFYVEVIGSQSRDSSSGLHDADKARLDALIENGKQMVEFGQETLDTPEFVGPNVSKNANK